MKYYKVYVNRPKNNPYWVWPVGYFPHKCRYLSDAKALATVAIQCGATAAKVECPDGCELYFAPKSKKISTS